MDRIGRPVDGRGGGRFWTAVIALSGGGSVAAVRLATPATLDERTTTLVLFFLLPGVLILLLGRIRWAAGVTLSVLLPVFWLLVAREESDSPLLWLVPGVTGSLIVLVGWRAEVRRASLVATLAGVLLGLGALFWPGPGLPGEGPRVLLVGVDGATWVRIDPLTSQGRLPNFAQALAGGHRARLRSLDSMYSPQIWSTIATGCPVSVHGIEDFGKKQTDFRVGRIWDELKREGRSFGVCGWYFTWPPLSDLGHRDFMIPSMLAPDDEAHPPEYSFFWRLWARERRGREGTISYPEAGLAAFRLGVRVSTLRRALFDLLGRGLQERTPRDQKWRSRRLYAAFQGDIFAELLRACRPEFAAVLFTPVDNVSHWYWKYLYPQGFAEVAESDLARYGQAVDALYEEIDRNLGKILGAAPEDVNLLIVSDHGFQAALARMVAGKFCRIRTENLIDALGLEEDLFGTNVDEKVYLRALGPSSDEREALLGRVESVLAAVRLAGEEKPLFTVVREGESLRLTMAPRASLPRSVEVEVGGKGYAFDHLIRASEEANYSGIHHPDGIYLLSGPSAARSVSADSLHVFDVAPTVAALLDLPVSPHWPGRAALEGVSLADRRVAEYTPPFGPDATPPRIDRELKDKLKALGYLE